ncbi:MAG TPA: cytochrome c oxidase subunit II [Ignavibacteriaceae bacterium]|nr:cytochrome c oxidase subunit II [Ignavibacteriaceae bacterium]
MSSGASTFVTSTDTTFFFIVAVSVFFLVVITACMIFFVIKFNRKRHPKAKNIHGNIPLEITWTVIPTILVLIMFWMGWKGYKKLEDVPADAMNINVTAQMWRWSFQYPNGATSDTLYVPVNKPIKVLLHSRDVNHSFFIPAFRVKKDVIPNRNNYTWFQAEKEGSFDLFCAEYCGLNHSHMLNKVVVMSQNSFNEWLNKPQKK